MAKNNNATRKLLWILGILLVVAIIAIVGISASGILGGGDRGTEVELAEVASRDITQVVTASGKVQPEVEVKISPDVSGEIVELRVKEGDDVEQGDLLVRIKQDDYLAQVEQAQAGVLQAKASAAQQKANLLNAEIELKRQQALFEASAISEGALQTAQTQYEVAEATHEAAVYGVQSAEARLRESRDRLRKTTIYAPMSGTVSKLDIEFGERVVGTSQMQGTEMMRIARLNQMELEVDVNENDVVNIAVGDSAAVEIDAYPDQIFHGLVTEIANSARVTAAGTQEQVTNFPVKIRILDSHNNAGEESGTVVASNESGEMAMAPNFRPGMSGTVDIFTMTVEDVIAIPIQSVTVRDINQVKRDQAESNRRQGRTSSGDSTAVDVESIPDAEDLQRVVFVAVDGKADMRIVETGISDDSHIEVRGNVLSAGDKVVIGPYRAVSRTLEPDAEIKEQSARGRAPSSDS